jgi:carboxylesterase
MPLHKITSLNSIINLSYSNDYKTGQHDHYMKKGVKRRVYLSSVIAILILLSFFGLYSRTGFLQLSSIDHRDLTRWEYNGELIKGAEAFTLPGSNDTCWYLIHGYTSTPDEMRELAKKINSFYNETVFVTRLEGHGEVPSHILELSLDDWHTQTSNELQILQANCNKVNLVGFSFGGALSARLAEENEVNHIYLIAPYLYTTYHFYYGLRPEAYLRLFEPILHYSKKTKIGQINSPEGLENHIAYWNMPFAPVKNSREFLKETESALDKISEPILAQHSTGDKTSDVKSSKTIISQASSEIKELILFERSNHILIEDYDKDQVANNIIDFEKRLRA